MKKDESLRQISCDPECGFLIRSHDLDEIKSAALKHVKTVHHMKATEKDLDAKVTMVA